LLDKLRLNSEGVMIRLRIARLILAPPGLSLKISGRLLDHRAEREQRRLLERPADQLQPERQALRVEAARHRNARQAGHVHCHCEDVVEIHLDRHALTSGALRVAAITQNIALNRLQDST
jgi:hypothetical protein